MSFISKYNGMELKQIIDGKPDSFYPGGCGVEGELGNETAGSRLF